MKKSIFIILAIILFTGCENSDKLVVVNVQMTGITNISDSYAMFWAEFSGSEDISNLTKGFCWSKYSNPTTNDFFTTSIDFSVSVNDQFAATINDLSPETKYYVRAFIRDARGNIYYSENNKSFQTLKEPTHLANLHVDVEDITSNSALVKVFILTYQTEVTSKGFCWGTELDPNFNDDVFYAGPGNEDFEHTLEGLESETIYYVRGFATTNAGTNFSVSEGFKTSAE